MGGENLSLDEIRIPDAEKMAEGVIKLTIAAEAIPVCHAGAGSKADEGLRRLGCLMRNSARQPDKV